MFILNIFVLCYTDYMSEGFYWSLWAQALKRRNLNGTTATVLDLLGPLSLFLVQGFYMGRPFFKDFMPDEQWDSLVGMLENKQKRHSFISLLLEEND